MTICLSNNFCYILFTGCKVLCFSGQIFQLFFFYMNFVLIDLVIYDLVHGVEIVLYYVMLLYTSF